jgi:serine/threonine protein phosphatase PrpC
MVVVFSHAEAMNPAKRNTMEDVCVIHKPGEWGSSQYTFVGLFDGHGGECFCWLLLVRPTSHHSSCLRSSSSVVVVIPSGREMADFLRHAMAFHVAEEMEYGQQLQQQQQQQHNNEDDAKDKKKDDNLMRQLGRAFLAADVHAKQVGIATSGATVAVCLIDDPSSRRDGYGKNDDNNDDASATTQTTTTTITTANVGDSRVCLYRPNEPAVRMTTDHVPTLPKEAQRIQAAGGFVRNGRVCGVLAISRSLGDQSLKQYVVARPCIHQETVITTTVGGGDRAGDSASFLIIACDGFWDVVSDNQAGQLVRDYLLLHASDDEKLAKETVAEFLVQTALRYGTTDNVTIVVAWL